MIWRLACLMKNTIMPHVLNIMFVQLYFSVEEKWWCITFVQKVGKNENPSHEHIVMG